MGLFVVIVSKDSQKCIEKKQAFMTSWHPKMTKNKQNYKPHITQT